MAYTPTPKEQYAEQYAKARIDFETAQTSLRDAQTRVNFAERAVQDLRTLRMSIAEVAHEALNELAANAETAIANASENWIASLVLPMPQAPPSEIASAYLLTDPSFVASMHAQIERVASSDAHGSLSDRTRESIEAELEVCRDELSDAKAAKREAELTLKEAGDKLHDYDLGQVRINA